MVYCDFRCKYLWVYTNMQNLLKLESTQYGLFILILKFFHIFFPTIFSDNQSKALVRCMYVLGIIDVTTQHLQQHVNGGFDLEDLNEWDHAAGTEDVIVEVQDLKQNKITFICTLPQ